MADEIVRTAEEITAAVERDRAEARKFTAEADQAIQEAKKASLEAASAEIDLDKKLHARKKELADDEHYRVYRFTSGVGESSVKSCMSALSVWNRIDPKCKIEIVFTSPGGDIIHGMALYDYLQYLRREGHHLTTVSLGYAASMAGILLQAGDVRAMSAESWLLIHEASFGTSGSYGDVVDTVDWVKRIQDRILDIFAERSKLSKRAIKNKWHRKDWWLSSSEALKYGFCDEIR